MNRIVKTSRLLKWSVLVGCVALPLVEAGYWITSGYPFLGAFQCELFTFGAMTPSWDKLDALQKLLGFMCSMIPVAFSMTALIYLAKLFAAFEKMSLFEQENVRILSRAGKALLFGQVAYPFYTAALSLVLTYRNPVGERVISLAFGPHQFKILIIGLAILVASWVFQEAVRLREEQEATI